jgi:hypothetical protein
MHIEVVLILIPLNHTLNFCGMLHSIQVMMIGSK